MIFARSFSALLLVFTMFACQPTEPDTDPVDQTACDAEPTVRTTSTGVAYVRTPDACFADLADWPYAPHYVEIDGLRQAYVDEGPVDGPPVLLLHGQPSWSYLYRHMIPTLVDAGYRVIAMDHLGMGRSDKPAEIATYGYVEHSDRLVRFMDALELNDINLFVQDWGSLIGLRVVGLHPERFARVAVGNGGLPVIPAGVQPFPAVEDPDEVIELASPFAQIPAQQVPFYDGCELLNAEDEIGFDEWMTYAMKGASFRPSEVLEALTWFELSDAERAAYDAPFPSRAYMAGPRVFPSLVNDLPGKTEEAFAGLASFERPFLTLWAENDPGTLGACETQQGLVDAVPGATGMPHDRLGEASHFLQDDQGVEIATRLSAFFRVEPTPMTRESRYCELLIVRLGESGPEAEVWGTPGLGDCPQAHLDALDLDELAADLDAVRVVLNGPRHWIPNATTGGEQPSTSFALFGEIPMRLLASINVDPAQVATQYTEATVLRTTTYVYNAREEVYELTSPDNTVYVMQSMSLISDPTQSFSDLPNLGSRLTLPDGWAFRARTLDDDLVLVADGEATVLVDDVGNTYQRR